MAILIMLNNYLHDLSVALFFCTVVLTRIFIKVFAEEMNPEKIKQFIRFSMYLSIISFILILLLGVPRAIFYKEYEWLPAAGRGQVNALIVKHIVFATLTLFGILLQIRLLKKHNKR